MIGVVLPEHQEQGDEGGLAVGGHQGVDLVLEMELKYLCGNGCNDSQCCNYLSFPRDSGRRQSHDLVEHTFRLGI